MQEIDEIIEKKRLLLPILEEVQKKYSYLPDNVLRYISRKLNIPYTQVYGTATFYLMFEVEKRGKYIIRVCNSPTCHIKGSLNILELLKKELDIGVGETTDDKKFTLELSPCFGCCDQSPAIMVNDELHSSLTEEKVKDILTKLK